MTEFGYRMISCCRLFDRGGLCYRDSPRRILARSGDFAAGWGDLPDCTRIERHE